MEQVFNEYQELLDNEASCIDQISYTPIQILEQQLSSSQLTPEEIQHLNDPMQLQMHMDSRLSCKTALELCQGILQAAEQASHVYIARQHLLTQILADIEPILKQFGINAPTSKVSLMSMFKPTDPAAQVIASTSQQLLPP